MTDQVLPKPGTSKIREREVQRKFGRPGTHQTWHLEIGEYEVQQYVSRPGTPQTWHLKNRGNEVQRKVGRPGTPQTWHLKYRDIWGRTLTKSCQNYSPDLTLQISQGLVFIYPFGTQLLRHILKCAEIGLRVYSREENIECRPIHSTHIHAASILPLVKWFTWQDRFRYVAVYLCSFQSMPFLLWCKMPEPRCYVSGNFDKSTIFDWSHY